MTRLITQKEELLYILKNILPSSKNLYFLVGYFYFSGFVELYKELKDKKLQILVGLDIEVGLEKVREVLDIEFPNISNKTLSKQDIRNIYFKTLNKAIIETEIFDNEERIEAFKVYVEKLRNGTLEIRKTEDPNHAKVYIFEFQDSRGDLNKGNVITGSSNLTYQGLTARDEFNVHLESNEDYEKSKAIFDKLWADSHELISKNNIEEFEKEVMQKIWIDRLDDPFFLYIRVLKELFDISKENIELPSISTGGKFLDLKYQRDAIKEAISKIKKYDGIILADVVGLGKSIIASAVAKNLNLKTVVICPPALIENWKDYKNQFNFNGEIYSNGKITEVLEKENNNHKKLIIIDEAHKYRNQETIDYGNLHKLCQGHKVMLLTATPFNNRPEDIFALIKFFQIPALSTIQTVENLSESLRSLTTEYKKIDKENKKGNKKIVIDDLSEKIKDILYPVVIRRTRVDLKKIDVYKKDLDNNNIVLNDVEPPLRLHYELGDLTDLYIDTLDKIETNFKSARYMPSKYLKENKTFEAVLKKGKEDKHLLQISQKNLAKFMKRLLISRFESSQKAFEKTLDNMITSFENMKHFFEILHKVPIYQRGNLPDASILQDLQADELDEELDKINQKLEVLEDKGLETINAKEFAKTKFIPDLDSDIKLLKEIRFQWFGTQKQQSFIQDPKIMELEKTLENKLRENPKRKIVIFSEYSDTVDYIVDELKDKFKILRYNSSISSNKGSKKELRQNFDASIDESDWKNNYDILITTDTLSEGVNLNRAGIVINYDIPYNPVRVIQRVGRIDRIGKKVFDKLFIYNFFPSAEGEKEIKKHKITSFKIRVMNAVLGADTKVLDKDEDIDSFYKEKFNYVLDSEESWDTKYRNFLNSQSKEIINQALDIPKRSRLQRSIKKSESGVLIFGKRDNDAHFLLATDKDNIKTISPKQALQLFEANKDEKANKTSANFNTLYQTVKKHLFKTKKTKIIQDKGKRAAIDNIQFLAQNFPDDESYFKLLVNVITELDGLTDGYEKMIRNLNFQDLNNLKSQYKELKKNIPLSYLQAIINKASSIQHKQSSLILSEELI